MSELENMTLLELRNFAKAQNIKNISKLKKEELIVLLNQVAEDELNNNKEDLEQKKENTQSLEYIESEAREKLGMYLQNERVYVDSNM